MSKSPPNRIAILGGGLSGLATAVHLHRAAPERGVRLFEAQSQLGGTIGTERTDGLVIDQGADMFATQPGAAIELLRGLGVEDRLIEPQAEGRGAKIVHRGRLVPVPDGFVLMRATKLSAVMSTPLLSPWGKLRLLAESVIPKRESESDESVGSFVRRRMGKEVLERIVAPLVAGIYTADVEKLSMQATMGPFVAMERKHGSLIRATLARRLSGEDSLERTSSGARYGQFRAFPGGMAELIETLAEALPAEAIATESPVESLRRGREGWEVTLGVERVKGGERAETFDHVVVATPASVSSRLLKDIAPRAAEELAAIEYASTAIVVLVVPRSAIGRPAESFGFVVPPVEQRPILAASFASEKFAGRAPYDQVIVRVFFGGVLRPDLLQLDDGELIDLARRELGELIGLEGEPILSRVVRWNDAMPQYHVGHLERVERIRESVASAGSLSLVSNALDGVGIAPLIAQAGRVANEILGRRA